MALYRSPEYQTSLSQLVLRFNRKGTILIFKTAGHLAFPTRMILATVDLQVTSMILDKFQVSWHFDSGEEAKHGFSK